jgi:hypothetical protein
MVHLFLKGEATAQLDWPIIPHLHKEQRLETPRLRLSILYIGRGVLLPVHAGYISQFKVMSISLKALYVCLKKITTKISLKIINIYC